MGEIQVFFYGPGKVKTDSALQACKVQKAS